MLGLNTLEWIAGHPLSRGRRMRNVAHFVAWQVRSRLGRGPHTFAFANGSKMFAQRGMTGATGNIYAGLHEFAEMGFLLHFLRPGDLFADVGANVGSYTILAGAGVGARVIAFEPGEAMTWLRRNIELNRLTAVEARSEAVGARAGTVAFTSGRDTMNRIAADGEGTVPITTLDAACGDRIPALIKIDVEGLEADVLRGAAHMLGHPAAQAVIMELNDASANGILERAGFACCSYDPFTRAIAPGRTAASANGIFIKDLQAARLRVESAPPFSVQGWVI